MKKQSTLVVVIIAILAGVLSGCSDNNNWLVGEWFNGDDIDDYSLTLTSEGHFSYHNGECQGNWTYENGTLYCETTTEGWTSTALTVYEPDEGGVYMVDNENGETWFPNYDEAVAYHEQKVEDEIAEKSNMLTGIYGMKSGRQDIFINEDGTYEVNIDIWGGYYESGTWEPVEKNEKLYIYTTVERQEHGKDTGPWHDPDAGGLINGRFISERRAGEWILIGGDDCHMGADHYYKTE